MTPEQVKSSESWEFFEETKKDITYLGNLLGFDCMLIYTFNEDKLINASLGVGKKSQERPFFKVMKLEITNRYGEPNKLPSDANKFSASLTPFFSSAYGWTDEKNETDIFLTTYPRPTVIIQDKKYYDTKLSNRDQPSKVAKKPTYVVRKANWRMSPEQIEKSESWRLNEEKEEGDRKTMRYSGTLLDYPCNLTYKFKKGVLTSVIYSLFGAFNNAPKAKEIKDFLTHKYGKPTRDHRSPPSDYWITNDGETKIVFSTLASITLVIFYDKVQLEKEEREAELKIEKEEREAELKKTTTLEEIF